MESIDTHTASGRMFIKIIGIFAEFERENIVERTRLGFERKAKEGYSLCTTHASYGYMRDKGQKIQTINEKEAVIVREIFDMYVNQKKALIGIAKILNIRQVPTKFNTNWTANAVRDILQNCNYIGKVRYSVKDKKRNFETAGLHEPIIEEELFYEAKRIIEKNKKITKTKKPRTENYYLGFLYCPKCDGKLSTHGSYYKKKDGTEKYTSSYKCGRGQFKACDFGKVSHNKINIAFEKYMKRLKDIESKKKQRATPEIRQEILEETLNKLNHRENELWRLYIEGRIGFTEYKAVKNKLDADKKETQDKINKLNASESIPIISKEDIIMEFVDRWHEFTDIERREFLTKFVKKIDITIAKSENEIRWVVVVDNVEFV